MSSKEIVEIRPLGWETDPEEERYKLSTIDPTPNCAYNNYGIFFRLPDSEKSRAVELLKSGLERTLAQARHFCGTIEKDEQGGYSFVKKRESSVQVVIHDMDPNAGYPSLDDIEKGHFGGESLKDVKLWSNPSMTWGERPEANPDSSPVVSAYQINLCVGGLVFFVQLHHYSCDAHGFSSYMRQLAANCLAAATSTPFPPFNTANLDVSRLTIEVPADRLVDGPPVPQHHPGHREQESIMIHIPKSKAAELKRLATPEDGGWVSTYDACCAQLWRVLSRVRATLHEPAPDSVLWWGEGVDMRPRLHNPPIARGLMRNAIAGAFSDTAPVPPLTVADVVGDAPLSRLARYVRAMTESCDEAHVDRLMAMIAHVRDKRSISLRVDSHPPMSMFVTDHRAADISGFDFGFGKPITYRHIWGGFSTAGVCVLYAPVRSANPDEGCVFAVTMEKELVGPMRLLRDFSDFFEYRGID
ncbi:hypothetical protein PspLS_00293 [Pyricularia sp. CBS 133598]|nr:hypothetical protein PspLS_00293 [Pyricularia sp. CBS 133598]